MLSWEKGGVAPIYLCESHAVQLGMDSQSVTAPLPQSVSSNYPTEQPKAASPSGGPADAQAGFGKKDLADVTAPVRDVASSDSAKTSVNEAIGNVAREDSEAYTTGLQRAKPSATEERQAERTDLEHICVSRYGERCTFDASVHCPKCGRWFCDAHGEDEKWHACALLI
jgi:hypothetical protein